MKFISSVRRYLSPFFYERFWTPPPRQRMGLRLAAVFFFGWVAGALGALSGRLGLARSQSLTLSHQDPDAWVFVALGLGALLYLAAAALWATPFFFLMWKLIKSVGVGLISPARPHQAALPHLLLGTKEPQIAAEQRRQPKEEK